MLSAALAQLDYAAILNWVDRVGLSLALVIAGLVGAYKVAHFLAPLLTEMAKKHGELIDTLSDQSVKQTECMQSLAEGQREQGDLLRMIHEYVFKRDRQPGL